MKRMLILPLLLGSAAAAAQDGLSADVDYGYFELAYLDFTDEIGSTEFDGTGFSMDGSLELRNHVHAFLSFRNYEYDADPGEDSGIRWGGLGTHWQIADRVSVFGRLGFLNGDGDDGYFGSGGVRYMPGDGWEIRGGFRSFGWDEADSATGGFISGDMWLTDVAVLTFTFESIEDTDSMMAGMRFYFGN